LYSGVGLAISAVVFLAVHSFARPPPRTMTKEWQEATNEYLKVRIPLSFSELATSRFDI
jgi:cytochrome c oxidase subunit 4